MRTKKRKILKHFILISIAVLGMANFTYAINTHNLQAYNNYCDSGMIKSGNETNEESNADVSRIYLEDAINNSNGVVALKEIKNGNSTVGKFIVVDGRILAAFPYVAFVGENSQEYNEIGNIMHEFDNYNHPDDNNEGRFKYWGSNGGGDSNFRYVDVVFEKDGNKKHQYVVPFIMIAVKDLHYRTKIEGYNAAFVDNRYGQVYQNTGNLSNASRTPMVNTLGWIRYKNPENGDENYLPEEYAKAAEESGWPKVYYPHRDEIRTITRYSPIEPFIDTSPGQNTNTLIRDALLLTPKDRIVNMRVYKHRFDANDKRHFLDIRDDESKIKNDYQNTGYSVLEDDVEINSEVDIVPNIIINYSQINYVDLVFDWLERAVEQDVTINYSQ